MTIVTRIFLSVMLFSLVSCSRNSWQQKTPQPKRPLALVAGGAGFIGSHLCERLLQDGYEVYCLDNLFSGRRVNLQSIEKNPHFHFIKHDVRKAIPLQQRFSLVFNLACPASPPHYQRAPLFTIKTCVMGTLNLLEIARRNNSTYFQASTSEVYGDPECHPQVETYRGRVNPIGPRACYDEGKRIAETICFEYHRQYGLAIKVGRIFNTYGPRMSLDDGRVVSNFFAQALDNIPLTIYGKGMQTRSFCYVDDLVEGIVQFVRSDKNVIGPMNLGNAQELTIAELAHLIQHITASTAPILYQALPEDDPLIRQPDISLAKRHLGWEPKISLNEGLQKSLPYFHNEIVQKK